MSDRRPYFDRDGVVIYHGDCLEVLRDLPSESVNCVVTSPPYFGLRDYGVPGQIGLESEPVDYVARMVEVFRQVGRVLTDDGTVWLNLGDSYAGSGRGGYAGGKGTLEGTTEGQDQSRIARGSQMAAGLHETARLAGAVARAWVPPPEGLKCKDLCGIPWRVAFALQADGWYLRSDVIWHKPNPMPESVTDRPTKAHEYLFLLAKSQAYYYDQEAIAEPVSSTSGGACFGKVNQDGPGSRRVSEEDNQRIRAGGKHSATPDQSSGRRITDNVARARANGADHDAPFGHTRNKRSVWTINPASYDGAHFAVFPPKLIEPCILAGCPEGGTVLDPFLGSGTTAAVAQSLGRKCIGIELNLEYCHLAKKRFKQRPLLA